MTIPIMDSIVSASLNFEYVSSIIVITLYIHLYMYMISTVYFHEFIVSRFYLNC